MVYLWLFVGATVLYWVTSGVGILRSKSKLERVCRFKDCANYELRQFIGLGIFGLLLASIIAQVALLSYMDSNEDMVSVVNQFPWLPQFIGLCISGSFITFLLFCAIKRFSLTIIKFTDEEKAFINSKNYEDIEKTKRWLSNHGLGQLGKLFKWAEIK